MSQNIEITCFSDGRKNTQFVNCHLFDKKSFPFDLKKLLGQIANNPDENCMPL